MKLLRLDLTHMLESWCGVCVGAYVCVWIALTLCGFIALVVHCSGWRQHQAAFAPTRQRDNHKQIIFQLGVLRGVRGIIAFWFMCVSFFLLISPTVPSDCQQGGVRKRKPRAVMQPAEQKGALI